MQLDHVLICTTDLEAMLHFFEQAICLEQGPRPPFLFDGVWLYSEGKPIVHLAASGNHGTNGAIDHIAFSGDDYESLITRLKDAGLDYFEHTVPGSKKHQVFVPGPDGIKLEIQFPAGQGPE